MDHSMHDMGNMGASASSSIMSMAASATMSMATATATPTAASHDMSHMDMSGMSMSMGTFHWSSSGDGIWFDAWVPKSEGAYIGACFGLFFFAILSRGLPALEAYFIAWKRLRDNRVAGNQSVSVQSAAVKTDLEKSANPTDDSSSQSFSPNAYPSPLRLPAVPPFSWTTDTVRSFLSAFNSFISYLLMMVVMTGNGGFLVVIVIGVFFGEMAFGRFRALGGLLDDHAH
ncbi:ubiquitin-like modifier hub1 [Mucor velutinosus]|uniref:Copper transport protein n=1 Tax=Mucor velutinosus TaxID=708070 RepID=A0AAN7DPZ7_9FUNG|nr:ubiquitin-like modifier hub1 [Mucor velutinosus]